MRIDIRPATLAAMTGLAVTPGLRANQITWDATTYSTAIYGATTNSFGSATRLGTSAPNTTSFSHTLTVPTVWYYWVRSLDKLNREAGTLSASVTAASQLATNLDIAEKAVKNAMVDVGAIKALNIYPGTITAYEIDVNYVYAGTLAANKVTAGTLQGGVVYAGSIAASQITAGTLVSGVVYAGSISAGQISAGSLYGMTISGGTIDIGGALSINSAGSCWLKSLYSNTTSATINWDSSNTSWFSTGVGEVALRGQATSTSSHGLRG